MTTFTTSDGTRLFYPGAPHGLAETEADRFNADVLSFIRA